MDDVEFTIDDQTEGWLAIADTDQLDQVLWALLDNAVKYGGRRPVDGRGVASKPAVRPPPGRRSPTAGRASPTRTGSGCSVGSSGAAARTSRAAGSACTCRASCAGRWTAISCWSRRAPGAGRRSASTCRASPRRRADGRGLDAQTGSVGRGPRGQDGGSRDGRGRGLGRPEDPERVAADQGGRGVPTIGPEQSRSRRRPPPRSSRRTSRRRTTARSRGLGASWSA